MQSARFDEMHAGDGEVRAHYRPFADWLQETPEAVLQDKRREAELAFHRVGITFTVYDEDSGNERLIPFFRANRQQIVGLDHVADLQPTADSRLSARLDDGATVLFSARRSTLFRERFGG